MAPSVSSPTDGPASAADGVVASLRRRFGPALCRRVGIDTRALAVFRVGLGLLVLGDLLLRARGLGAFYTDAGVLPRSAHAELFPTLASVSLHAAVGSTAGQAALFGLSGVLSVLLAVGYRTRLASAGVLLLHASLYARNPYVLNGGDGLLVVALFLAVFLPLGERWSVDASRRDGGRERVCSLATAAVLAQMVVVYVANVPFKRRSDAWMAGDGVQYALELEQFAVHLGPALTAYPGLLTAVNWLWIGLLVVSPLLLAATGWLRAAVAVAFVAAHLGMLATMRLGLFPLVVVALLLLYLPSSVWARLETAIERLAGGAERGIARRLARRQPGRTSAAPPWLRRGGRVVATVLLAVFLVASVGWPATALGVGGASGADPVVETDGYVWTLFAPNTPTHTRWYVAPATLGSGERVDALGGGPVEWTPPPDAADTYPSALWHRYLAEMRFASDTEREAMTAYFCRRARTTHGVSPANVSVYAVEERIDAAGGGEPSRVELGSRRCE